MGESNSLSDTEILGMLLAGEAFIFLLAFGILTEILGVLLAGVGFIFLLAFGIVIVFAPGFLVVGLLDDNLSLELDPGQYWTFGITASVIEFGLLLLFSKVFAVKSPLIAASISYGCGCVAICLLGLFLTFGFHVEFFKSKFEFVMLGLFS